MRFGLETPQKKHSQKSQLQAVLPEHKVKNQIKFESSTYFPVEKLFLLLRF